MSNVEKFLDTSAEMHADIDHMVNDRQEAYRDRLAALLSDVSQRDEGIFEQLEVPIEATVEAFEAVPVYQRSIEWTNAFAQVFAACRLQTFIEIFGLEFLQMAEDHGTKINSQAKNMSVSELKEVSKKRDLKARIGKSREQRYGFK